MSALDIVLDLTARWLIVLLLPLALVCILGALDVAEQWWNE